MELIEELIENISDNIKNKDIIVIDNNDSIYFRVKDIAKSVTLFDSFDKLKQGKNSFDTIIVNCEDIDSNQLLLIDSYKEVLKDDGIVYVITINEIKNSILKVIKGNRFIDIFYYKKYTFIKARINTKINDVNRSKHLTGEDIDMLKDGKNSLENNNNTCDDHWDGA